MTLMQSVIKKGDYATYLDTKIFNQYHDKEITLQECKQKFYKNNKVERDKRLLITDSMFEDWLRSLGYWVMDYKTFRNEMLNYRKYKSSVREIEEKIDYIVYKYAGVRAIEYDKIPGSHNPNLQEKMLLKMSEELEEPQRELDFTYLAIQHIESKLAKLPEDVREMAIMLFVDNYPLQYVGIKYGYSRSGVHARIKREVEKIWDTMIALLKKKYTQEVLQ